MNMMIRSKVIKIGNSHGIRIPQALLEQVGLTGNVEMTIEGNKLIIRGNERIWAEMASRLRGILVDKMI